MLVMSAMATWTTCRAVMMVECKEKKAKEERRWVEEVEVEEEKVQMQDAPAIESNAEGGVLLPSSSSEKNVG